jgi:hypothetical protein
VRIEAESIIAGREAAKRLRERDPQGFAFRASSYREQTQSEIEASAHGAPGDVGGSDMPNDTPKGPP